MAKFANDLVLDGALDYISTNGDKIAVCSAQPATYAELSSAPTMLAIHDMVGGDYTKADGDVSGRKLTVAEQATVSITNSGTATHVAIGDATSAVLVVATLTSSQALTNGGNTVTIPAFDIVLPDPV
jgi:hypothetical protein